MFALFIFPEKVVAWRLDRTRKRKMPLSNIEVPST
jgi:hypothetical protein